MAAKDTISLIKNLPCSKDMVQVPLKLLLLTVADNRHNKYRRGLEPNVYASGVCVDDFWMRDR